MAARLKMILHIKASQLSVRCCSRGLHLGPLFFLYLFLQIMLTEPVQDKMFLKYVRSHRRSALYVRIRCSVGWSGMVEESKF